MLFRSALLVGALTDSVGGAGQGSAGAVATVLAPALTVLRAPAGATDDGMIARSVPSGGPGGTELSTAKDA